MRKIVVATIACTFSLASYAQDDLSYESVWKGLEPKAKARCAELHDSFYLQEVCLKNEKSGYLAMKSNYGMPSKVAMAAKDRCLKLHPSWYLRDVCMKNESKSYQKLNQ